MNISVRYFQEIDWLKNAFNILRRKKPLIAYGLFPFQEKSSQRPGQLAELVTVWQPDI